MRYSIVTNLDCTAIHNLGVAGVSISQIYDIIKKFYGYFEKFDAGINKMTRKIYMKV